MSPPRIVCAFLYGRPQAVDPRSLGPPQIELVWARAKEGGMVKGLEPNDAALLASSAIDLLEVSFLHNLI